MPRKRKDDPSKAAREADGSRTPVRSAFERLPHAPRERAVLFERLQLLGDDATVGTPLQEESIVVFRLGAREHYGVWYQHAEEILPPARIASVPCTPAHIAGVVNRRGELLTVLDLRLFFRTEPAEQAGTQRILVVSASGMSVGVLVDELVGYEAVDRGEIAPPIPSQGVSNLGYVHGIYRGEVTLLDIEALLGDQTVVVEERVG
jgi:purine-binding chemotaxis protein CheW